ncbi:hypothetical protein [Kaistella faecalis]|uniref:hypothetical protein n=1 Tax=Kaistella faecalis TaxID=2852098 RepID=UPI001C44E409|nr:hypothetical protein [Chryseobacterium faecale]UFK97399.1 hypothetical protein LL667_10585 [Chryseobacterium faecale]
MARVKKNGNLSGTIGNIVFVNDGERAFVRAKPDRVKQTTQTKAAAGVFGLVSSREKTFRLQVLRMLGVPAPQYFAAKQRARIRKTVTGDTGGSAGTGTGFGNPQALAGFSFNPEMEWESCTNFFLTFEMESNGEMKVHLPELKWKNQIIPVKNSSSAVLTLVAITADLNKEAVPIKEVAKLELEISGTSAVPAQDWIFPVDAAEGWLLIIGCLKFGAPNQSSVMKEAFSAAYLWTGMLMSTHLSTFED